MDIFTNIIVDKALSALDSAPVNAKREDFFLSSLVCRDLVGLCELGIEIMQELKRQNRHSDKLPDPNLIKLFYDVLLKFYSDDMFEICEADNRTLPKWNVVEKMDKKNLEYGYKIFRAIKNNINKNPAAKTMTDAIENRNTDYFIENFDLLFQDVPFQESLNRFKNFLALKMLTPDQEDMLWAYFDNLMYFFNNEKVILADLQKQK